MAIRDWSRWKMLLCHELVEPLHDQGFDDILALWSASEVRVHGDSLFAVLYRN